MGNTPEKDREPWKSLGDLSLGLEFSDDERYDGFWNMYSVLPKVQTDELLNSDFTLGFSGGEGPHLATLRTIGYLHSGLLCRNLREDDDLPAAYQPEFTLIRNSIYIDDRDLAENNLKTITDLLLLVTTKEQSVADMGCGMRFASKSKVITRDGFLTFSRAFGINRFKDKDLKLQTEYAPMRGQIETIYHEERALSVFVEDEVEITARVNMLKKITADGEESLLSYIKPAT
jgi:hypothetical protein